MIHPLQRDIRAHKDESRIPMLQSFFKTGKGQYAEGDIFLGLTVPLVRTLVKKNLAQISLDDIEQVLQSKYHEERLAVLIAMVYLVKKGTLSLSNASAVYLRNTARINNWDLVDTSAVDIIGAYCAQKKSIALLKKLAKSPLLWERRIAMVATLYHIRRGSNTEVFVVASLLLNDNHDLIQKAVGWMLRESGRYVSRDALVAYIHNNIREIRPTTLRYAIEHLPKEARAYYLEMRRVYARNTKSVRN
jgi:3-methyladenine DNA glycosylase AlkD